MALAAIFRDVLMIPSIQRPFLPDAMASVCQSPHRAQRYRRLHRLALMLGDLVLVAGASAPAQARLVAAIAPDQPQSIASPVIAPPVIAPLAITPQSTEPLDSFPLVTASTSAVKRADLPDLVEQGRQHYVHGKLEAARESWQQAAQQAGQQGDRPRQILSLSYLSLVLQDLNQWDEAAAAIAQSLSLLQTVPSSDPLRAQVLNTQGRLLLSQGKAQEALNLWQQAETAYAQAGDRGGQLGAQINQAQALQSLGFYRRSRQQLERVNQVLQSFPDSQLKLSGLRALGNALQLVGDTNSGEAALQTALELAEQLGADSERSAILQSLGKTAAQQADRSTALEYFEQAASVAVKPLDVLQADLHRLKLAVVPPSLAPPLQSLALSRSFQSASAQTLAHQLLPQLQQLVQHPRPSRAALYAALQFTALQDTAPLVPLGDLGALMASTQRQAHQLQDRQTEAYALHQWGKLYLYNQQWSEAAIVTQKALEIGRSLQAKDIIAQAAWQMGRIYRQQRQRPLALQAYEEAVGALQSLRGDLVAINPDLQFSFRESVEPVYRELVGLLLENQPSQAELIQARQLIESLQVAELDNFFREACLDKTEQIDQVDPTASVIYPIQLADRVAMIVATAGEPLRYYSVPQGSAAMNQALDQLLASFNPGADLLERQQISQRFYDWLIRPAEQDQAFKHTKTLVFVLDGRLRSLPIAALHDGRQYLVEKYAVALSPGLHLMQGRSLNPEHITALVGGISQARPGFRELPGVERELQAIAQTVPASTLLNQAFTHQALTSQLQSQTVNVVHLATHGQFSSRLEETFLVTWDGRLNLQQLAELLQTQTRTSRKGLDLLVLSACDTAVGDDRAVLGLAGLAVKSGARSTVATLWPVKDYAAAQLMTYFYQQLHQPGQNKAEALRQAQIMLIRQSEFADPFFWSAFVLVGNWR